MAGVSILLFLSSFSPLWAGIVKGRITDKVTGEPLAGAAVLVENSSAYALSDADGYYSLKVENGKRVLNINYIGYKDLRTEEVEVTNTETILNLGLEEDTNSLDAVTVVAQSRNDTGLSIVKAQQRSLLVQTGVGAQQIAKTQDKDASEVIRRVPGISIIDDKFVMVRGLSQRYNNVWLNGGAVPSSEADSRAFSFDIIPSSQIENLTIIKSPAPEYPADFTGGFVLINTKREPEDKALSLSLGGSINDATHFRSFITPNGGYSRIGMSDKLSTYAGYSNRIDPIASALENDWTVREKTPWADLKLSMNYSRMKHFKGGSSLGVLASANYSNSYKTLLNTENSLYGPYDITNDTPVFLRKASDSSWNNDSRLGAMLNLNFEPADNRHFFEWKNIFNRITKDRYSERTGFNAQPDNINDTEYYYSSRSTYNTQFTGHHNFEKQSIDWNVGYAYANRNLPDRKLIERTDRTDNTMGIYRISREFTRLDEHIFSAGADYKRDLEVGSITPALKGGVYGEYRTRKYRTREFQYGWQPDNSLSKGFLFDSDVAGNVLTESNYGADKLYLYEEVNMLNNYNGAQAIAAAYLGINIPLGQFDVYAGGRYEYSDQVLTMNTRQYEESPQDTHYEYSDFFPSVNITYHLNPKNQLRLAYGRSVNRPEFRELSTSVYYDFELGSNVMGNYDLKAAYIDNFDFRYEYYPTGGEQISVAVFYKKFKNPIEWTYTVAGGTDLIYSFINAEGADNYGVEVDFRKDLDFIGLKNFSCSFNGALIKSKVRFAPGTNNIDRPMQGQSPYLVNLGLFYNNPTYGWNAALLYNRIGKRIIGVGNRYGTDSEGVSRNIPDSYEMPRNSLDLSVSKKFGDSVELSASVRNLLDEEFRFSQFEKVTTSSGEERTIEQVNRLYKVGRTFNLTLSYTF